MAEFGNALFGEIGPCPVGLAPWEKKDLPSVEGGMSLTERNGVFPAGQAAWVCDEVDQKFNFRFHQNLSLCHTLFFPDKT